MGNAMPSLEAREHFSRGLLAVLHVRSCVQRSPANHLLTHKIICQSQPPTTLLGSEDVGMERLSRLVFLLSEQMVCRCVLPIHWAGELVIGQFPHCWPRSRGQHWSMNTLADAKVCRRSNEHARKLTPAFHCAQHWVRMPLFCLDTELSSEQECRIMTSFGLCRSK
jgi:hypothetical protein